VEALLQIGLTNAVAATVLAALAAGAARVVRRPALTHALWALVLLKLMTPPVWTFPVQRWLAPPAPAVPVQPALIATDTGPVSVPAELSSQSIRTKPSRQWRWLPAALGGAWLAGSAACLGIAVVRCARFTRLLRFALLAPPGVQAQARGAARRIGLGKCPAVWILPGPVCPMLWAAGGPARVIVPEKLWEKLSASQREGLLLHELAHVRRRDHWVRVLELGATVTWWWNPVVWWARLEMRTAEEECCDAWVTGAMPGGADDYASALVEAVDFASVSRPLSRPMLPALASGIGEFGHLKRRLVMIQQGNANKSLGPVGIACVCAMGLLLPMALTWAQATPGAAPGRGAAPAADKPHAPADAPAKEDAPAGKPADEGKPGKALAAQLERQLPELKFDGVGFSDVIDFLRDVSGANIFVNWKSLEAAGIDRNAPTTIQLRNVKFSQALALVLDAVAGKEGVLSYRADGEVITITAREPDAAGPANRPADEGKPSKALDAKLQRTMPHAKIDRVDLSEVIDFLRDVSGIYIVVDWKALEAAKIDKNTPVTLHLENVKMDKAIASFLDAAAGKEGVLYYRADGDVITITARGPNAGALALHVYNIKSLVNGHPERMQSLVRMITGSVDPSSWQDKASGASIATDNEAIVVVQTEKNQKAVANLLEKAGDLLNEKPGAPGK
jgi:beta-lactamase regulating signal transducer with metallopeptidase domain